MRVGCIPVPIAITYWHIVFIFAKVPLRFRICLELTWTFRIRSSATFGVKFDRWVNWVVQSSLMPMATVAWRDFYSNFDTNFVGNVGNVPIFVCLIHGNSCLWILVLCRDAWMKNAKARWRTLVSCVMHEHKTNNYSVNWKLINVFGVVLFTLFPPHFIEQDEQVSDVQHSWGQRCVRDRGLKYM